MAKIRRVGIALTVTIRPCLEDDLADLEWFGLFSHHRALIQAAFTAQERGDVIMLVADANGFPVGQVWIDIARHTGPSRALVWGVRVLPPLQRAGIGTHLMRAAEQASAERGFSEVELGVERTNPAARRFYERLGYRTIGTQQTSYAYTPPGGALVRMPLDLWVLRKDIHARLPASGTDGHTTAPDHPLP